MSKVIIVVIVLTVAVLAGAAGFFAWQTTWTRDAGVDPRNDIVGVNDPTTRTTESVQLMWQQTASGWRSFGTVPPCPTAVLAPVDLNKVTAVLYPGQTRGGNYKPHGGFRLDGSSNQVQVVAPLDGYIVRGGHYLTEGEIQYTFDIMNNCGLMYRVGHFRSLPSNLQKITATWPPATEGDSRTHFVNPPVYVQQGDVLATAIGIIGTKNTFFDWGVYDYRQTNTASKSPAYQQAHMQDKELSWHAICWFDLLSPGDEAKVRALPPGDPTSGKTSDYCR